MQCIARCNDLSASRLVASACCKYFVKRRNDIVYLGSAARFSGASLKVDYSDEVAGFTNANQVCVTADPELLTQRLRDTVALFTPVFYIEPVFFEFANGAGWHPR